MRKKVNINFQGFDLIVTGDYSPAETTNDRDYDPEDATFDMEKITLEDSKVDIMELFEQHLDLINGVCLEKI